MFGDDFYVFSNNLDNYGAASIYCVRKVGANYTDLMYMTLKEDGTTCWTKFEQHTSPKPFMIIPWELKELLFPKLAQMLDGQGIKTESIHKIEGTLEAQNAHLQDLRKIVCGQLNIFYEPPKSKEKKDV